jgi:5-methylthioadenosine/S-adenosylhomocysteine deaminase
VFVDGQQVVAEGKVITLDQVAAGERLIRAQRRMLETAELRDYRNRSAEEIVPLSLPLAD